MSVETGIDICVKNKFKSLNKEKIGLLVHSASVDSKLRYTQDLFIKNCKVTSLFGPEHGIYSKKQAFIKIKTIKDKKTGLPVYSLYGKTLEPTKEMLKNIDILVIDLQDIGTRYYTYIWTMALAMKACARYNKKVVVLDRPNPINGVTIEGTVLDTRFSSFVGMYPIPVRHGMTIGELAGMFNKEFKINSNLEVIKMNGWHRRMWVDETGVPWILPSPNMPTLETAIVYPGMCLLEGTNISEGRGTTRPFETFGSPWISAKQLYKELDEEKLPGVRFKPVSFVPTADKFKGKLCKGAQIHITDRNKFSSFITGVTVIKVIKKLYPESFIWKSLPYEPVFVRNTRDIMAVDLLIGNSDIRKQIDSASLSSKEALMKEWGRGLSKFAYLRKRYLLY